ncbi:uncharacterized protein BDR25DRAFT_113011 [Lindgomyces ingoldianus]|uniref:Uncharacterized protein n=1 Tax=Lindgomyces ingoldianus TaxID=673940 RepID=A0ACB6R9C2_9PLEO|nr:uncharacterized protein BDR25DRAFT_113011 [Lindgomyces ingoldianus]KAF2474922.1 hypothetical protein BDR25DRAFT_113011 [Lindgomyces ingoldianus]
MRLLRRSDTGEFTLTEDFVGDEAIPRYAILSHTWGADAEEVTFEDLTNGTGRDKPGYEKIWFCGEQAAQDDLQYFWIDTCCTIQTYHRRQRPTKRVAYAAENSGRISNPRTRSCNKAQLCGRSFGGAALGAQLWKPRVGTLSIYFSDFSTGQLPTPSNATIVFVMTSKIMSSIMKVVS